ENAGKCARVARLRQNDDQRREPGDRRMIPADFSLGLQLNFESKPPQSSAQRRKPGLAGAKDRNVAPLRSSQAIQSRGLQPMRNELSFMTRLLGIVLSVGV